MDQSRPMLAVASMGRKERRAMVFMVNGGGSCDCKRYWIGADGTNERITVMENRC